MPVVLIAEDEETLRVLSESILIDEGLHVLTAANGEEALAILAKGAAIDLLFTDLNMGKMNGLELASAARGVRPDLKVLYTSGAGVTDGTRAMFVDRSKFLPKAYKVDDLISSVKEMLDT